MSKIAWAAWPVLLVLAAELGAQEDAPWQSLFDGSLDGWSIENSSADNFTVADGLLRVAEPDGWLRSAEQYGDFRLRIEFRFVTENADSGIFVRAVAADSFGRGWPNNSYQLQLRNPLGQSRFPPVGGLFRHGSADGPTQFDPYTADRASTGTGVWQTLEIRVVGDVLTAWLNGAQLTYAQNIANPTGYIGIQAETGVLEFRRIEIRPR